MVALWIGDAAAAAAVVLVDHRAHDGRARGDGAVEDRSGSSVTRYAAEPPDVVDGAVGALAAEHDPAAARPQPLGVHDDRRVGLVAVGRVLGEADRA